MKRYYVFYDYGSCLDGSHVCGLDEFDTLQLARLRADELHARLGPDGSAEVIEGVPVARG